MSIKSLFLLIFFLFSSSAFALIEFPKGKCELEGKITHEAGIHYFIVNPGTNSEIRLKLSKYKSNNKDQDAFVKALIVFQKKIRSFAGEAEIERVIQELNPYKDPIRYSQKNMRDACSK